MNRDKRSIFRSEAVTRYIEERERSVLPTLVSPKIFIFLWILIVLLGISGLISWIAKIPVYASGKAVINWDGESSQSQDIVIIAFLQPDIMPYLKVGQTMILKDNEFIIRFRKPIMQVEKRIISPDVINKKFLKGVHSVPPITQPMALVFAPYESSNAGVPASSYIGSVFKVDIEIDSRRLISFLPLIGKYF